MNNSIWLILLLLTCGSGCGGGCGGGGGNGFSGNPGGCGCGGNMGGCGCGGNTGGCGGGGAMTLPGNQPVSPWCNSNPCSQCGQSPQPIPSCPCAQQPMVIPSCQNTGTNSCEWIIILLLLFCGHPTMPLSQNGGRNNMCC